MDGYKSQYMRPTQEFPEGGIAGNRYMRLSKKSHEGSKNQMWAAAVYELEAESSAVYINVDVLTQDGLSTADEQQFRVGWCHTDDIDLSEAGWVYIDPAADHVGWEWAGSSASVSFSCSEDTWYTLDIYAEIDPSGLGRLRLLVNGVEQFDIEQFMDVSEYTQLNEVLLGGREYDAGSYVAFDIEPGFDNFKVNDDAGNFPDNTYPGHTVLIGLPVTGAGARTELTPCPEEPNWDNIEETPPSDSDFNDTYTLGEGDTYAFTDTPEDVLGLSDWSITRFFVRNRHKAPKSKSDEGFRAIVRLDGVDHYAPVNPSSLEFACWESVWTSNPATGAAWQKDEIDGAEAGAEAAAAG
jgi:hypothetical protein